MRARHERSVAAATNNADDDDNDNDEEEKAGREAEQRSRGRRSDNVNEKEKRQEAAGSRLRRSVRRSVGRHSPVGRWWGGAGRGGSGERQQRVEEHRLAGGRLSAAASGERGVLGQGNDQLRVGALDATDETPPIRTGDQDE